MSLCFDKRSTDSLTSFERKSIRFSVHKTRHNETIVYTWQILCFIYFNVTHILNGILTRT